MKIKAPTKKELAVFDAFYRQKMSEAGKRGIKIMRKKHARKLKEWSLKGAQATKNKYKKK